MKNLENFLVQDHIFFEERAEGFPPILVLQSERSRCKVALYGAHILSFEPKGTTDLLWVSQEAVFSPGTAIRGGIPVCWPWFGAHPDDVSKPSHGFARIKRWNLEATGIKEGIPFARLILQPDAGIRTLFDYDFRLELTVMAGETLEVALKTTNTDDKPFVISEALHSYFDIGHIADITVEGLEGCDYIDQLQNNQKMRQDGSIMFNEETDRVYIDTEESAMIVTPERTIKITKEGSLSTVVWNPWIDKAARMKDFGDHEYLRMLCIETANVAHNAVMLTPGEEHTITLRIKAE